VNGHPLKIFENPDPEVLLKILKEPKYRGSSENIKRT
jgi:hypothetical protein